MQTYDPNKVQFNVGAITVSGFADGTFIKITRNTPELYKRKVGAKGEVSRTRVSDQSGTIEVTLKQTSPYNSALGILAKNPATFPASVISNQDRKFVAGGSECWIEKAPDPEFASEETNRTWVFGVADLSQAEI